MKQILRTVSVYAIAYVALLVIVLGLLYAYPKVELHMLLNGGHTAFLDTFFKYYSVLAEWPLYVLALLPLLWRKWEITLFYAICELAAGAVVQILKHLFMAPRPIVVFENYPDLTLPLVEGVSLHHSNSFPSGHTSTFFVFFTCCALLLAYQYWLRPEKSNRKERMLFNFVLLVLLGLAALGGFSRIYLSQHFLMDVCVGGIIGVLVPCVVFFLGGKKILKLRKLDD